jgi:hypothetical protein
MVQLDQDLRSLCKFQLIEGRIGTFDRTWLNVVWILHHKDRHKTCMLFCEDTRSASENVDSIAKSHKRLRISEVKLDQALKNSLKNDGTGEQKVFD